MHCCVDVLYHHKYILLDSDFATIFGLVKMIYDDVKNSNFLTHNFHVYVRDDDVDRLFHFQVHQNNCH